MVRGQSKSAVGHMIFPFVLILLLSVVLVAAVISLVRCCLTVSRCCMEFCGSWSSPQDSNGIFLFVSWWGTCRTDSPALPSLAASLSVRSSPLPSYDLPSHPCPVTHAATLAQLCLCVCSHAIELWDTLPSCATTPAQSCSHLCTVTYIEVPKKAHVWL